MKTIADWQQKAVVESRARRTTLDDLIADSGILNELPIGRTNDEKLVVRVEQGTKERIEREAFARGFDSISELVRSAINRALTDPDFKHWSQS